MSEQENKKCKLGFNEEKIFVSKKSRKNLVKITDFVPTALENNKIICIYKPELSKSDREDLGYYYKKGKLFNLHYVEVPVCIFCEHYK